MVTNYKGRRLRRHHKKKVNHIPIWLGYLTIVSFFVMLPSKLLLYFIRIFIILENKLIFHLDVQPKVAFN
jgi:hypothetical protein